MDNRVDELSRFIERPTTRLKETERLLARQLEVSDREPVLLRTLVADGPMITEELGGCDARGAVRARSAGADHDPQTGGEPRRRSGAAHGMSTPRPITTDHELFKRRT